MKAKEYAAMIKDLTDDQKIRDTLVKIGIMFDKETSDLVKSRNAKTDSAFKAILNEMDLSGLRFQSSRITLLFLVDTGLS